MLLFLKYSLSCLSVKTGAKIQKGYLFKCCDHCRVWSCRERTRPGTTPRLEVSGR